MDADGRPQRKSTSPWAYVAIGCGLAVLLGLIGVSGFTYLMYRQGKQMAEGFKDPKVREQKTREVLAYKTLPAGYYAMGAFSVPLLMDFAILSDKPPEDGKADQQGFEQRSFIFMNMRHMRDNREKMERYLRGEAPAPEDSAWQKSSVNFDAKELIGRGTLNLGGMPVLYAANRGDVHKKGEKEDGIVTMVLPECPDDRLRFGVWIGPDPQAGKPVAEANYAGTNADPAAMHEFLSHFDLCGGKK